MTTSNVVFALDDFLPVILLNWRVESSKLILKGLKTREVK
jgi:hypothetical protein